MAAETIIYPAIAMFFLTFSIIVRMGVARFRATARREVSLRFYRLYNEGEEPPALRVMTRHTINHFEVPPLFYIVVLFTYASGQVSALAVVLAWLYVGLRLLHSYIHLGRNNVTARFYCYGASGFVLAGLWLHLLIALVAT